MGEAAVGSLGVVVQSRRPHFRWEPDAGTTRRAVVSSQVFPRAQWLLGRRLVGAYFSAGWAEGETEASSRSLGGGVRPMCLESRVPAPDLRKPRAWAGPALGRAALRSGSSVLGVCSHLSRLESAQVRSSPHPATLPIAWAQPRDPH